MALTRVDLSALPELVSALAAAPAGRPGGPVLIDAEILRTLRDLLQADVVLFNDLAPTQHAFWAQSATMPVVSGPGRDAATDEFFSLFWSSAASHPDRTGDRVTPTCLSDFMTIRQWRGSGMYSLLRPVVDFERQLLLPLPGPPGHSRRVRFLRSRGRDFDDTHRAVASLIRPHLVAHLQAATLSGLGVAALTDRQRQLIGLLANGYSNNQIARALAISPATVRTHLQQLYQRLGVSSRGEVVALFIAPPSP